MTYIRRWSAAILVLSALTGCSLLADSNTAVASCQAGAPRGTSETGLAQVALCITSGAKVRNFTAEVAGTTAEQAKGLMFRTELADNQGMIFPFLHPRVASFWMKNTVIPLDIIFIRANGTIESIAENTIPYSTVPVEAGEPVAAVLELRGGLTAELGIGPGDKVQWQSK